MDTPITSSISRGGMTQAVNPLKFKPVNFNGQSLSVPGAPATSAMNFSDPNSISSAFQNATTQANNANNQRYSQGLGVLSGGFNSALANMGNYGATEKQALKNQLQQNNGKTEQDSVSRGIGNTTIRNSLLAGNQRTFNQGMTNVNENVARDKNALLTGGAGSIASFIANRNDAQPDLSMYASLLQAAQANQMPQQQNVIRTQAGGLSGNSWQGQQGTPAAQPTGDISSAIGGQYIGPASGVNVNAFNPYASYAAAGGNISAALNPANGQQQKPCQPPFVC